MSTELISFFIFFSKKDAKTQEEDCSLIEFDLKLIKMIKMLFVNMFESDVCLRIRKFKNLKKNYQFV